MKIINVRGTGFGRFKFLVEFSLDNKGLLLLVGQNLDDTSTDSNGAGKSTLPDLVTWILWGVTAKGVSGDGVINWNSTKAYGHITIEDGENVYGICRERKVGKETLSLTLKDDDLTCGTVKLTQEKIARILGCSYEIFRAAVYVGQEDLPDLPAMSDKVLKELVETAAGIDVLERSYMLARERLGASERQLETAKRMLETTIVKYDGLVSRRDDNVKYSQNWIDAQEGRIGGARCDAQDKTNKLFELEGKTIHIDVSQLEKASFALNKRIVDSPVNALVDKLNLISGELERKLSESWSIEDQLEILKDQKQCSECGHVLAQNETEAIIDRKTVSLNGLKEKIENLQIHKLHLENQIKELPSNDALKDAIMKVQQKIYAGHNYNRELERLQNDCKRANEFVAQLEKELNPFSEQVLQILRDLGLQAEAISQAEKQIFALEGQVITNKNVVEVFSPAGVRAQILDQVTPFLNQQTSNYLSILSDGNIVAVWNTLTKNAKGEIKEKFSIEVTYGESGSFKDLSGGEKRKVRIACALALQDLIASRATKPFNVYFVDEIDTALDNSGLERLMMVLQEKARSSGTVVVISHSDLKNWCSNIWTITRKDGQSTLSF